MILFDDIFLAYRDCRRRKSSTPDCIEFESNLSVNLYDLTSDLNSMTYEVSESTTFIVDKPKPREIFAGNFRDRIVHHLLMMRFGDIIESEFIPFTYSCRKKMGGSKAIKDLSTMIEVLERPEYFGTKKLYFMKCDLKSFFMTIDKYILKDMIIGLLDRMYEGSDKTMLLSAFSKVILNNPSKNCKLKGYKSNWDKLEPGKSLFTIDSDRYGLPIGNYTSQVCANYYLTPMDKYNE